MPGGYSGDVSHYQEDAAQFAAWGVDFIKLDWCGMDPSLYDLPQFKGMSKSQVAETLTKEMSAAISDSGRAMVLDVNDGAGITSHGYDWQWGSSAGAGMWRIACDIKPNYADIVRQIFGDSTECGHSGAVYLGGYAGPGKGWNDPDMLEVGNGPVTHALAKVQLSLWAEEAAPLIMGHNLASFGAHSGSSPASIASMSSTDFSSVSDSHMIAVDQDPLGIAGHIVYGKTTHHWVLTRPLTGGRVAVVLFNGTYRSATLASPTSLLGLSGSGRYIIYNVWGHKTTYLYRNLSARVNPYSADLLVIGR
jgi:alpha-galactosidase